MRNYIIRRIFQTVLVLLGNTFLLFLILHLVPGGPYDYRRVENPKIPQYMYDRLYELIDFDKPILPGMYCRVIADTHYPCVFDRGQYVRWLEGFVRLDFGDSWVMATGTPAISLVMSRLGYTLILMVTAFLISLLIAIPAGIYSATHQYSEMDYYITGFSFLGQALPTFWTSLVLVSVFTVALGWLPYNGVRNAGMPGDIVQAIVRLASWGKAYPALAGNELNAIKDGLLHMAMPVAVLVFFNLATWIRYTRSAMLDILHLDYMRTARAKGLKERIVVVKHGLRNALVQLVTMITLAVPTLFGGAVIIEWIFSWPGLGRTFWESIVRLDWPVAQCILVLNAVLVMSMNFICDLLYAWIDPRIKYT
jgi:peptide/nickel transport system permease protein